MVEHITCNRTVVLRILGGGELRLYCGAWVG